MDVTTEKNCIIDKNKIEHVNKYIYTKFPKFDTHKKIKLYNIKISELILENEKLKKYKSNLEKRILEENTVFEENFKNYEIAISNALRLGYSSLFLCNVLNKMIDRNKKFVLRELMKRKDEFKNNIIKSYIHKYSVDKLLINNMAMKIDCIYKKNVKSVTILLVGIIKKKIRYLLKLFLNNILGLKEEKKGKKPRRKESDKLIFKLSFLNHIERVESLLGLVKLVHILRTRIYIIFQYCFSKLVSNKNENLNVKENTIRDKEKFDNINGAIEIREEKINYIKKIKNLKNNNIENNNNNNISKIKENSCLINYISNDNKNTEKICSDMYLQKYDEILSKKNYLLLNNENIINNFDSHHFSLESGNESDSSYIPHPDEIYNYLYYQELLKLKKKKPENCFAKHIDSNSFNSLQLNSEELFLCDKLKKKNDIKELSTTNNLENYIKYVENKLKKYNNIITKSSKKIKKEHADISFNELGDSSKLSESNSESKKNAKCDKSIYIFLLKEKRRILELLEQYVSLQISEENYIKKRNKKGNNANLNKSKKLLMDDCKQKQLESLNIKNEEVNKEINKERINKINIKCKPKPNISLKKTFKESKTQLVTGLDKEDISKINKKKFEIKNIDDCNLEVESFVNKNIKKKLSFHTMKSELKDIISHIYDNNDDIKEKRNLLDNTIDDIKNKLSKIKEKSFLCVIGEGSPKNINLNFKKESEHNNKKKEENVDILKKSESKVLLTLKK
ncbi:conserved Plasmodium protein, unknown function [Plasmodium relictum]|uniref:Uncharacterized protein n=1 Tax=Plasmodium relictum TaxID=85471 RepID=A0A1J1H6B4_PLARL|nr:conserved Plasmodium protein, unknown function [Plasmodium relictum]CRH00300.1 conserved Plasmodium protein, unknown function [Plasmodium relictum]